jgi:hypothetical protein
MSWLNILDNLVGALQFVSEQVDSVSDLAMSHYNSFLSNTDPLDLDCLRWNHHVLSPINSVLCMVGRVLWLRFDVDQEVQAVSSQ